MAKILAKKVKKNGELNKMAKTTGKKPLLRGDDTTIPDADIQETPEPVSIEEERAKELESIKDGYKDTINNIVSVLMGFSDESLRSTQEVLDNLEELHHKSAMEASAFKVCMHSLANNREGLIAILKKLEDLKSDEVRKVD